MALSSRGNGDRDVMANLAARLMGRNPTTPPPASPKAPASESPRTISAPPRAEYELTPTEHKSAKNVENTPPNQAAHQEDINMTDVNTGPSLFGNADQIAEARRFAQTATTGRSKSNSGPSSRASRQPLFSQGLERGSVSSSSSSPRSDAATVASGSGSQSLGASRSTKQAGSPPTQIEAPGSGLAALHNGPPVVLTAAVAPTPAPTPVQSPPVGPSSVQRWNTFSAEPSTEKTGGKAVGSPTKLFENTGPNHAHPSAASPKKKDETKTPPTWQLRDVTNTLKGCAGNATIPPHLCTKAEAAGIPEKKTVVTTNTAADAMVTNNAGGKKIDRPTNGMQNHVVFTNGTKGEQVTPKKPDMKPMANEQESKPVSNNQSPAIKSEQRPDTPKQAMVNGTTEKGNKDRDCNDGDVVHVLKGVKEEMAAIGARVGSLEDVTFATLKDVEKLLQAEERRKFLGTDSAKVPFAVDVKCLNGKTYNVQVNMELKVHELIRRVRTKANLAPTATANPRIIVDREAVGHGMTLGEMDISKEKSVVMAFSYDEV